MNRNTLLIALFAAAGLVACGDNANVASTAKPAAPAAVPAPDTTTMAEGIVFSKQSLPGFVSKTEGIAGAEPFGRWTDGAKAVIEFKEPLPKKFELILEGAASGPNVGKPVKVTVGGRTKDLVFDGDMTKPAETKRLAFDLDQPASRIEFLIPHPTRPANSDVRELGIALISLKVDTTAK